MLFPARRFCGKYVPRTIGEAGQALRQGSWRCTDLTAYFLDGLEQLNPVLRAMISVDRQGALDQARRLDAELQAGHDRGPLHGIPFVNKDLFAAQGLPWTLGSPLFRHRIAEKDAVLIASLRRAGCVLLGQANLGEFAAVPAGHNQTFGHVANPWKHGMAPGSSSSGSAAALAAGLCLAATGSDTGSSIRGPASYCGVVGLRPTAGRFSLEGSFPRAPSLDAAGMLSITAHDMLLLLASLAPDLSRTFWPSLEQGSRHPDRPLAGLRAATVAGFTFAADVDPSVQHAVRAALNALERLGATITEEHLPLLSDDLAFDSLYTLLVREFSQVLGPLYDSVPDKSLFDPAVQRDMEQGRNVSEADYISATCRRAEQQRAMAHCFERFDVLITPTTPTPAPAYDAPPDVWGLQRKFVIPVSYLGLPAVSVPCGVVNGLPVGLQLIGRADSEYLLLQVAHDLEQNGLYPETEPEIYWKG